MLFFEALSTIFIVEDKSFSEGFFLNFFIASDKETRTWSFLFSLLISFLSFFFADFITGMAAFYHVILIFARQFGIKFYVF